MFSTSNRASEQRKKSFRGLLLVILAGMLLGTLLFRQNPTHFLWESPFLHHGFLESTAARSMLQVFCNAVTATAILFLLMLGFGFSAIGQPFTLLLLLWRGIALGCSTAATYAQFGIRGLPIVLLLQLPHALITSVLLVLAVRESWRFSNQFTHFACMACQMEGLRGQLRLYLLKFGVLLLALLLSAALDSVLTYCLTGVFLSG